MGKTGSGGEFVTGRPFGADLDGDTFRRIAASLPDVVVLVDTAGRIVWANDFSTQILPSLVGRNMTDFVPIESVALSRERLATALAAGVPCDYEQSGHGIDGDLRTYDCTVIPVPDGPADGELTRALIVARDASLRKRAEDVVRTTGENWRTLLNSLPDEILVVDRSYTILSTNRATGTRARAEVLGAKADACLDPTMVDEWRRKFALVVETCTPLRFEIRGRNEFGRLAWYESTFVPLKERERVDRVMVVARDITERRAVIASLAEKERLASLGMVAASVAHEVLNPLTYVLTNLEHAIAASSAGSTVPLHLLTEAQEGARRMREIVADLRSLGRTGSEELLYVDPRSVLESALRLSGPTVAKGTRVTRDFGEVPGVFASESRLCQVFINLLVNAAQSMEDQPPEQREIIVRTRHVEPENLVAIEIVDRGVGIARSSLERIFEPFYTTKHAGTGLGLSISRDIIHRMGGHITVVSSPGEGTAVTVRLSTLRAPPR